MDKINIGLTFPGTCEEAFKFYKSIFGGEFSAFVRFGDDPATDANTPRKDKEKIAYIALPLGNVLLYGDDTLESSGLNVIQGNITAISVEPDSKKEADKIYQALSSGGKTILTITDFPWGYCGILSDKFGVKWTVWYKPPQRNE